MINRERRLILANGEQYVETVRKLPHGRKPKMPREYEQARDLVKEQVNNALQNVASLPTEKKYRTEMFLCLRLHPDMTAKSYDPAHIFEQVPELKNAGSRDYITNTNEVAPTERITKMLSKKIKTTSGRLVFVRSSESGFKKLVSSLDLAKRNLPTPFQEDIQKIERFDILNLNEQILGFTKDWKEGRVELVFHPSRISEEEQLSYLKKLFKNCGIEWNSANIRTYSGGPTFISCRINKTALNELSGTNPLRVAHPLTFRTLEDLRGLPTFPAPKPPIGNTRSTIKVGVFDGGIDVNNPLLIGHAEEDIALAINTPAHPKGIAHGTAVTGALLYGALDDYTSKQTLPSPPVYAVGIRALPTSDVKDTDLYESIDVIEKAVPARPDIKVFNVSFGPRGPILDDMISRFTYVLDSLSIAHKVLFFVAVGNDGEVTGAGLDRIQSPADIVHGIGVGAYTILKGEPVHAPYSCKGPGRECGKVKPDLAARGGCASNPIHLVSTTTGQKVLAYGTSFASPIAAGIGAQATQAFDRATTLLARTLLIHTAKHPDGDPDNLLGHGCISSDIGGLLYCPERAVTLLFQGAIVPGMKQMIKLPILLPQNTILPGIITVTWTIAGLTPIDINHPADYTCCCIEDTFYPHSARYNFCKIIGGSNKTKTINITEDDSEAKRLAANGWKRSALPVTKSGNTYKTETERRSMDCKWEPLVRRSLTMRGSSLREPYLILHAIPRNISADSFDFAAVVTIDAPKYKKDLYTEIRRRYPALVPIRLRTEAEIRIQI